ncbi:MAG: DUF4956 domain-containing protein [Lachnospiraceae bacterium]|nr:DUF4956 domain-containing protein [Lachnospiraceae bacterium]
MKFGDVIKKSILEGFNRSDMSTTQMAIILFVTLMFAVYLFFIYKLVNKSSMYDKELHITISLMSVITAGIILAMQSNIVISLGMVGALSIVRFRTAVKSPMDLLFLFWSMGVGIICGAGLFEVALMVSLIATVGIFVLEYLPGNKKPYLLIINGTQEMDEDTIVKSVEQKSSYRKVKARNRKKKGMDMILEVRTKQEKELLAELENMNGVEQISLLTHEGEVRF